jgi:hypothetical protein
MRVILEIQRGIAAGLQSVVVDSNLLSREDAAHLERLVAAARTEKASRQDGQEKLTITDANGTIVLDRQLTLTEMSPAIGALRSWVREHGERRGSADHKE